MSAGHFFVADVFVLEYRRTGRQHGSKERDRSRKKDGRVARKSRKKHDRRSSRRRRTRYEVRRTRNYLRAPADGGSMTAIVAVRLQ